VQISNDFRISLPPDEAYELLLDLDRVAPCMPGAELGPGLDDGSRAVTVKVKLGPMRFTYEGSVRVAEQDPAERRAVLVGAARDAKTQAAAEARIAMSVSAADGGSSVASSSDVQLTGRAAQMGESVIASVVAQLLADMAANLERQIAAEAAPAAPERAAAPPPAPAPRNDLRAGRLVLAVVRSWFGRLFRRGGAATR
jgi:carbon monoxide dehydrogenase subunit G